MTFAPGENVGPYRVIEQLGQGGMATVFKAYHPALDREVAIKVLHAAFKRDPQFFVRFKREAQIVAKLDHPHIIPIYDFNEHQGEPYLVMRYVQGHTLKAHMQTAQLQPHDVLRLMQPVCDALAYAHDQGILHRDIKPSNIMLADDGRLYLTDFGMARMVQMGESTLSQDMLLGTPQYISPEQAQGMQKLDVQTDIYSLGVVLFEMLTGSVPFSGDTPFAVIHDHIYTSLPLPHTINPDIDPEAEKVILKALAKEPGDRFKGARDFQATLEAALGPVTRQTPTADHVAGSATPPAGGTTKKWAALGAGAMLVLIVLVACLLLLRGIRQRRQSNRAAAGVAQATAALVAEDAPAAAAKEAEKLVQQGGQLARQKKADEALEKFNQAIETDPHLLPAYYQAANLVFRERPEQAVAYLNEAVAANPDQPAAWLHLGYFQQRRQDFPGAQQSFEEALALEPRSALAYIGLARVQVATGHLSEAEANLAKAKEINPRLPEGDLVEAMLYWQQGRRCEAARIWQRLESQSTDLRLRTDLQDLREAHADELPPECGGRGS